MKKKTIVIAEIGQNHNGSLNIAKNLIREAKKSGADYVKFQTFITEEIIIKNAEKASYQKKNSKKNENQYRMLKNLELDFKSFVIYLLILAVIFSLYSFRRLRIRSSSRL